MNEHKTGKVSFGPPRSAQDLDAELEVLARDRLRAENERLREALRDIAWHGEGDFPHYRIKAAQALGLEGDPLVSGERRPPPPVGDDPPA